MCKNYDAPTLGNIVKAKIRNEWPTTLEKWDRLQTFISRYPDAQRTAGFADPGQKLAVPRRTTKCTLLTTPLLSYDSTACERARYT